MRSYASPQLRSHRIRRRITVKYLEALLSSWSSYGVRSCTRVRKCGCRQRTLSACNRSTYRVRCARLASMPALLPATPAVPQLPAAAAGTLASPPAPPRPPLQPAPPAPLVALPLPARHARLLVAPGRATFRGLLRGVRNVSCRTSEDTISTTCARLSRGGPPHKPQLRRSMRLVPPGAALHLIGIIR